MDTKNTYSLDPKIRDEMLSNFNRSKILPNDTLSESNFYELICSMPFPIQKNIKPGMKMTKYLDLLMEDTDKQFTAHNQIEHCAHQISNFESQIKEAASQISLLESNIRKWKKAIQKEELKLNALYENKDTNKSKVRGRPPSIDNPDTIIIKELIKRWIDSLKIELEVKSFVGLQNKIFGSARGNWEKWANGERIPLSKTMYQYLSMPIRSGKHKGKKLIDIPISNAPSNFDIFNLICRDIVFFDGLIKFDGEIPDIEC